MRGPEFFRVTRFLVGGVGGTYPPDVPIGMKPELAGDRLIPPALL